MFNRYTPETDYAILEEQGRTQNTARRVETGGTGAGVEAINGATGNVTLANSASIAVTKVSPQQFSFNLTVTLGTMATKNQGAAVADLSQTISNPPTQAEVQNIQAKVNELLGSLRTAQHIS